MVYSANNVCMNPNYISSYIALIDKILVEISNQKKIRILTLQRCNLRPNIGEILAVNFYVNDILGSLTLFL